MKKLTLALTLLAALTACSSPGTEASNATRGALELAVSQTCAPGSDPQCIPFYDEHILVVYSAFERAGVDSASGDPSTGESDMITVQLGSEGTPVVRRMTAEAMQAGEHARLVMKVGDDIVSAVRVQGELHGDHLQIALPPDASTEDILANLNGPAD